MYAHLVKDADAEARQEFDAELYAPAQGWESLERRFFELIQGVG